jgi:hypothetical protein
MKKTAKPSQEPTLAEIERTQRAWFASITEEDRREAHKYGYCFFFGDRSAENLEVYMNRATAAANVPALVASAGMLTNRMAIMLARKDRALRRVQAFMMEGTEEGRDPRCSMPAKESAVYTDVVKAINRSHMETI